MSDDRFLILAEGELGAFSAKTAVSVMRYRPNDVAAVIDSHHAGKRAREVLDVPCDAPVVSNLEDGLLHNPTSLLIGIAPQGGQLPSEWRTIIREALAAGLDIV